MTTVPYAQPAWLWPVLDAAPAGEGERFQVRGQEFVVRGGIPRALATLSETTPSETILSETQADTRDAFGFIWGDRTRFAEGEHLNFFRDWYRENYGDVAGAPWWPDHGERPLVVEAGCGAGISGSLTFAERLHRVRYLGVDISTAVDAAAARFAAAGLPGAFLQADLMALPLSPGSVDVIYSQGVLHHTDSTEAAVRALARLLRPGGRFLFYVYRRKGPIREFTDDLVRQRLQHLPPDEQWRQTMALTRLGLALGQLGVTVEVPEDVALLGIPAGPIDIQRLFYWHVAKAYYRPEFSLEEMNHVNLDWYAPKNAHRQSPEEVRGWCADCGLTVEREHIQEAGISIVARKTDAGTPE